MAILQAARAYVLGLSINEAKSWGLNRAIFYASAKKGFSKLESGIPKSLSLKIKASEKKMKEIRSSFGIYYLGDEMAHSVEIEGKRIFIIGEEIQRPTDFDRQIEARLGKQFKKVWEEAVKICQGYDKGILLSQRDFYESVYKPHRDELAEKWSRI